MEFLQTGAVGIRAVLHDEPPIHKTSHLLFSA
jgi:hypothetical protein